MTNNYILFIFLFMLCGNNIFAQSVGINTTNPNASAALDVVSTDKGVLVPRLTTFQKTNISNPAAGLMIYDTDLSAFCFYSGSAWVTIEKGDVKYVGSSYLGKTSGAGSTGTSEGTSANLKNVYIGNNAGNSNTTASENIEIGEYALATASSGSGNIGIGKYAGSTIGTGNNNTIVGHNAGVIANSISNATAIGAYAVANANNSLILGGANAYAVKVGIGTSNPAALLHAYSGTDTATAIIEGNNNAAYQQIRSLANTQAATSYRTSNAERWRIGKTQDTEVGGAIGSNFFINRYTDAGVYDGQPFHINRATGTVTIGNDNIHNGYNTLTVNGSIGVKVLSITTSINNTVLNGDDCIVVYYGNITGNTIFLPDAYSNIGRIYTIVNHTPNSVSISSYVISSTTSTTSIPSNTKVQLVSDGSFWHKIN